MKSLLQAFNSSFEQQKKDAVNLYIGKAKITLCYEHKKEEEKQTETWK